MFSLRHRLGLDTEHTQNSLLEQAKDNVETADTAQQQLENHAPGTRVHVEGKQRRTEQLLTPYHKRGNVPLSENTIMRKRMARPERFELPTFWFVAEFHPLHPTRLTNQAQQNNRKRCCGFAPFWLALAAVHGHFHGQWADSGHNLEAIAFLRGVVRNDRTRLPPRVPAARRVVENLWRRCPRIIFDSGVAGQRIATMAQEHKTG